MTQEELDEIVEQHQHWLRKDCEDWEYMMADLRNKNLSGRNLESADLRRADLSDADLSGSDLHGADLSGANLSGANLSGANLRGVNLCDADLSGSDLRAAILRDANLTCANLSRADLCDADLSESDKFRLGQILTESITGHKKTKEGVIITAEIPAGAIVFSINGRKFRTNRAKITDMGGHEVLHSQYDKFFEYRLGQEIEINDFNLMYNVECASGFHFFKLRNEAEEY